MKKNAIGTEEQKEHDTCRKLEVKWQAYVQLYQ